MMFDRIRQIHLFAAFILTTFILMYFITGFVMIFEETFQRKEVSVKKYAKEIPGISSTQNDTLISLLKKHFDLHGQYEIQRNKSNQILVNFRHPGTETKILIPEGSDSITLTISKKNFTTVMHHFHRLHGYKGGVNYLIWAVFYDLSAFSMFVFALTGIYLWYKVERKKLPGWIVIITFTAFVGFTLFYLMHLS